MTDNLDPQTATRAALAEEIARLRALTAECSCGTTYATYEGPEPDCPVHGAVRALNEAMQETAQLRLALADAITRIGNEELRTADARTQRDEARRDLAAATTALERIRDLCDRSSPVDWVLADSIRALLPAAGDGAGEAITE